MNKLERLDELRLRAEEALQRSVSGFHANPGEANSALKKRLTTSQIELILENETLRLKKNRLQAELGHYKSLYSDAPMAYLTLDQEGKIIEFNKAVTKFLDPTDVASENLSVYMIAGHQSLSDLHGLVEEVFRSGNELTGYLKLNDRQKIPGDYRVILSPYNDSDAEKKLARMMISQFPDQENYYKHELQKKEQDYHELMSNISDGIFYTEKGILNSVNPSLSQILGYSEKELEGRPLWDLVTGCQQKQVQDLFNNRNTRELKPSYDVKCVRSDGTVFWAELKIRHLSPGNKSFGIISDITQRKLSENLMKDSQRQLKRSNAAKDKLFSIMSHDLRTPFNTLMGYTYLLMKDYRKYDEAKRESMVRSLYDVTKQTFNMLENILVWSRSQTGGIPFAPRPINISSLLLENMRLYSATARAKSITLNMDAKHQDVIVFADPEMVQTVIRNLVTNAIKFTPEKGAVKLGLMDEDQEKITVYVEDNGVGIEPNKKIHLFQIDSNYSTHGTNDEKGTGLGLTVCKEFVEKNGGEIWADSSPGKGSRFSFTLYKKIEESL